MLQELRRQNEELRAALRTLDELRHQLKITAPRSIMSLIEAMKKPYMVLYQHKVADGNEPFNGFAN